MLNTPVREIERFADECNQGIVGRVAATERPYLNSWVSSDQLQCDVLMDPFYRETIRSTQAEVAVPIFAPAIDGRTTELVGVLNLESRIAGAFSALQTPQIEFAAMQLGMDIRIMQADADPNRTIVWHPDVHGWGTKRILDRICYEIATSHSGSDHPPTISATVWYSDTDKERFYVRGTSRYDFEYISDAFLGFDSFLGYTFKNRREGEVLRGSVDDLPDFRRRRKAERMELSRVAVTRFRARRQIETSQRSSEGLLALYSFKHELSINEADFDVAFTDARIRTLASQIGAAVGDVLELRLQAALALVRSTTAEASIEGVNDFDRVRDVLCHVLEAPAATCFINVTGILHVMSTTGLEPSDSQYVINSDAAVDTHMSGLTRYLGSYPGRVLRKVDVPDRQECCVDSLSTKVFTIAPENILRETGAVSRADHRRFIGASCGIEGESVGVVRLIRPESDKPFVESDEELLASALRVCEPVFLRQRERTVKRRPHRLVNREVKRLLTARDEEEEYTHAVERVSLGRTSYIANIRWLDSWLQDYRRVVGTMFPSATAALTHVRYAFPDDKLNWHLRIMAYHSVASQHHQSDDEVFPRRRGNIGWKVIDRSGKDDLTADNPSVIWFDASKSSLYDCGGIEHGLSIRSGVCVPVIWITDCRIVQGVVSIDFDDTVRPSLSQIREIFLCAHSLSLLPPTASPVSMHPFAQVVSDCRGIDDWLGAFEKDFKWHALLPGGRTDIDAICTPNAPSALERFLEQDVESKRRSRWETRLRWRDEMFRMGICTKGDVISLPLRVGPFTAFRFVGKLTQSRLREIRSSAEAEVAIRLSAECSRRGTQDRGAIENNFDGILGGPTKHMFMQKELGKFSFSVAERWLEYSALSGVFWRDFDVSFEQVTTQTADEAGLRIWNARFGRKRRRS